jgi:hypothetical protein
MNQELANAIKIYSIGTDEELFNYLIDKSKYTITAMFVDLLTMYINDKNSSTLREFITVTLAGYKHSEKKIGYNGFKQNTFLPGSMEKCEAKPQNVDREEFKKYENRERTSQPRQLNGGGNFTDYTPERLEKDKNESDLNMLVSGFVDGKLIYIFEFPFNCPDFVANLEKQVSRWKEKLEGSKSVKGQYLRSAGFNYKDFMNCTKLRTVFILPKKRLSRYKSYISKDFYKFLRKHAP